ncbi:MULTISPECIES: aldehyde dehydrogenase family protein [unclassified Haloferax]|uniref:aldehyde dehydrogenase family protein n=1 Tax=unclassified Haloferax TaxID=2625095 RepID=UPI000E240B81|nr:MULTISPECIES: aldehyde dehydrogenase family protein [unclassified Haloferax]RDZ34241.1 aldehyde dehydrogenase [Haloferax sp. Atlit-24N]RLM36056.1 aldehyde dehydrogenase family protein [Haloferax sp. Atlit-109R]RLM41740.1 aldehyde dehydrogenase family protein [Haloferax sp. Atlit-105R]
MVDDIATDADWNALYIDGEWTESESGESIAVEDPSTRETVAHVPRGTEADVDAAYEAAAEAQESWAEAPPARRQEVVEQFLQALNEYEDEIIDLLAHEVGGSRIMGETSIQIASDHASEAATLPRRMRGEHVASNIPGKENIVQKNPKGVVTVISPWNFPLNLSMRAVAPAVAAGNAVVLKPSTNSPITGGLLFAKLFEETDLPEGVVNVVTGRGSEIGDRVAGHPESDVVAFTGSTEVGKRVSGIAGENLAVPAMELGGNNAHIVTEGADVDAAVDAAVFGSFVHQGQVCISINRHIVHESVYDEYVEKLTERAAELPVGSAHEDDTVVGPIIDESQRDEMLGYVEETVAAGATLETGGSTADLDGVDDSLVVQPTVLSGVTNDMAAACNEHFGPIAPVIPFSDVDEAVELANATEYGLSGSVHAGDLATGKEIALRMETGNVHVNDQPINDEAHVPFSGIGASGVGTYNSDAFLDEITEDKWISLQHEPRDYPL